MSDALHELFKSGTRLHISLEIDLISAEILSFTW